MTKLIVANLRMRLKITSTEHVPHAVSSPPFKSFFRVLAGSYNYTLTFIIVTVSGKEIT